MSGENDSVWHLVRQLQRKAPAYLDLFTATTDREFDDAFDALMGQAVSHLEKNSKNFEQLDEVGLSAVLAAAISVPGLSVTQESHSNGHVDLAVLVDNCVPARKKLAEAKIYRGPAYHVRGLQQLLNRYTTGRESRGLLIEYFRKKNIAGLVVELRAVMDTERPCQQQGDTTDHVLKWSFLSTHVHSCGEQLSVGHIGCNLYCDGNP